MKDAPRTRTTWCILLLTGVAAVLALMVVVGARGLPAPGANEPGSPAVLGVGRILGLWAIALLLLQPLASMRLNLLDRAFGLDKLLKYHRLGAVLCLATAFLHPMLVYGSKLRAAGPTGLHLWREGLGALAMTGLWLLVVSSAYRGFLLLRWESWRRLHKVSIPVIGMALLHAILMQPDLRQGGLLVGGIVLLGAWLGVILWQAIGRPRAEKVRRDFTVKSIRTVARNITEVTLAPTAAGEVFTYSAGQFAFVRFRSSAVAPEEHPFTISSTPADCESLRFAIKGSGDHTRTIPNLRPGDPASVSGPFGGFTPSRFRELRALVLVAGGIGVTPMLSILRTLAATGRPLPLTLIWSNREEEDIPYRGELKKMQEAWPGLTVHYLVTRGAATAGVRSGRLDASTLRELAPPYRPGTHVMLCGPRRMMHDLAGGFRRLNYPRRSIHYEDFAL